MEIFQINDVTNEEIGNLNSDSWSNTRLLGKRPQCFPQTGWRLSFFTQRLQNDVNESFKCFLTHIMKVIFRWLWVIQKPVFGMKSILIFHSIKIILNLEPCDAIQTCCQGGFMSSSLKSTKMFRCFVFWAPGRDSRGSAPGQERVWAGQPSLSPA